MIAIDFNDIVVVLTLIGTIVIPIVLTMIIKHLLIKFQKKTGSITKDNISTIMKIVRIIAVIVIILGCLEILGVNIESLFVSLSLVTLALTLAAKELLSNLIAGLNIVIEKPFTTGDMIGINKYKGIVQKIGFKNVELLAKDETIIVPNIIFSQNSFINYTKNGKFMQKIKFSLQNNQYLDENLRIIDDVIKNCEDLDKTHKYSINVRSFDDNGVNITAKVPIKDIDNRKVIVSKILIEIYDKIKVDPTKD